jgi:hypothetical protein
MHPTSRILIDPGPLTPKFLKQTGIEVSLSELHPIIFIQPDTIRPCKALGVSSAGNKMRKVVGKEPSEATRAWREHLV